VKKFKPSVDSLEKRDIPSGVLSGYSAGVAYSFGGGAAVAYNNTVNNLRANGVYLGQGQVIGSVQRAWNGTMNGSLSLNFGQKQLSIVIYETSPGSVTYNYYVAGDDMGIPVGSGGQMNIYNSYSADIISF
jgi:hypothetical protein